MPRIGAIFFGPHDLAASSGFLGEWGHPQVVEQILTMRRAAEAAGLLTGNMAASQSETRQRRKEDFNLLAIGMDTILMARAIREMMESLERPVNDAVWNK